METTVYWRVDAIKADGVSDTLFAVLTHRKAFRSITRYTEAYKIAEQLIADPLVATATIVQVQETRVITLTGKSNDG